MEEEELWSNEVEDEEYQELEASTDPRAFILPLIYEGGLEGAFRTRDRIPGQLQRPVASSFLGTVRKKPAFYASCVAKAIIHGNKPSTSKKLTLLVYDLEFLSWRNTRIKEASIVFEFEAKFDVPGSCRPEVCDVRPKGLLKMVETTQKESSTKSLSLNIGPNVSWMQSGLEISGENSASKEAKYNTILTGANPRETMYGYRSKAMFDLVENKSEKSGIPTKLTVVILLEHEKETDFVMVPKIEVKPNSTTQLLTLGSTRSDDDPVNFSTKEPPFNELEGRTKIDPANLEAVDLESLWDCTMYTRYDNAIKKTGVVNQTEGQAEDSSATS